MSFNAEEIVRTFFNRFFWRQHPDAALRYIPAVRIIKSKGLNNSKILEIGSGSLGIVPYLNRKIDAVDIDFTGPHTDFLNKIKGRAQSLPFRKNSYDIVVSVDVLEHLEKTVRFEAIFEMLRVAKSLAVLVVPEGRQAQIQDKKLLNIWNKTFPEKNQFLEEHIKFSLPTADQILVDIDKSIRKLQKQAKIDSFKTLNLTIREILMRTWITKNKYLYYLYMKGFLLLLPLLLLANFGNCYRRVFVIELSPKSEIRNPPSH